jgi:hypothetical protein
MTFKLDIFKVLGELSSGDHMVYRRLSDDEKKGFAPLVIMRWMTGTSDERQIMAINTFANKVIFPLGKHPELLSMLLASCSSKVSRRYQWLGIKSSKKKSLSRQVVQDYFDYSSLEMRKMTVLPPAEEIVEMAEALGWQKDEMAKLKKELKE